MTAIGASAGPSRRDFVVLRQAAERGELPFRIGRQRMRRAHQSAGVIFRRGAILARDDQRREPAERRQAGAAALLRLLAVKALGIAGEKRADHRMLRLPGLHQRPAERAHAPGAARHLLQDLERALRRARIAVRQADIGIDDADEREQRKIMPLGDELRADDDIAGAVGNGIEFVAQPLRAAGKIRREDQRLGLRPKLGDFFRQAARRRGRTASAYRRCRIPDNAAARARYGRIDGRRARGGSDVRQARTCNSGIGNDGRRRGRASAAHSRGG